MMRNLSSDTKAAILLTCAWGKFDGAVNPLSLSEYNKLANWLKKEALRPGDLFSIETFRKHQSQSILPLDPHRLEALLQRGGVMAMEVERWLDGGMWILSRADDEYPKRLKTVLGTFSPPVIYGFGPLGLLTSGGIAVVGSRHVDDEGASFSHAFSSACARERIVVISGGARGVDQNAMSACLESGGKVVGVLASDLTRSALRGDARRAIQEERLTLFSPYHPNAAFNVGNAMARNKLIYALADAAVVVSSSLEEGGTWAGATENLEKWHVPLFVRNVDDPPGNKHLIKKGGIAFPSEALENPSMLFEAVAPPEQSIFEVHAPELVYASSNEAKKVIPSAYEILLPRLLNFTATPRKHADVASFLNVYPAQVDDWLSRAVKEEKMKKEKRGVFLSFDLAKDQPITERPSDSYEMILPHLLEFIESPKEKEQIIAFFDVRKRQASAWLKRAMEEGKIEKRGKKHFVAVKTLFL